MNCLCWNQISFIHAKCNVSEKEWTGRAPFHVEIHLSVAAKIVIFLSIKLEYASKSANWDILVDMEVLLARKMARLIYYAKKTTCLKGKSDAVSRKLGVNWHILPALH